LPKTLHFAGKQALLLVDSDHENEWLLRDALDVAQAGDIGQAVDIGRALRGQRARSGYVQPNERARNER